MLNIIISEVMLSVVMLNVVMMSVVAPSKTLKTIEFAVRVTEDPILIDTALAQ
jgi:hypothetical protein